MLIDGNIILCGESDDGFQQDISLKSIIHRFAG